MSRFSMSNLESVLNEGLVYDAVFVVILLCFIVHGARRGAFKAVAGIAGTILGYLCGWIFSKPVSKLIGKWISPTVSKLVSDYSLNTLRLRLEKLGVPEGMQGLVNQTGDAAKEKIAEAVTSLICNQLAPLLAFLLILVVVRIVVRLVCAVLSLDIPVLSTLNDWAGALIGAVSGLLTVLVICWAIWHFAPSLDIPVISREALSLSRIGGLLCKLFRV